MKKLLLPFILLFTIPFNASCIREITLEVVVLPTHCSTDYPIKKAIMGREYQIRLTPDDGFYLCIQEGYITIATANAGDITYAISDEFYNQETDILTIPSNYVTSKITITANAQEDEPSEQK